MVLHCGRGCCERLAEEPALGPWQRRSKSEDGTGSGWHGLLGRHDADQVQPRPLLPAGCQDAEQRLRFYASQFPVVEVNSSFYALPSFNNSVLLIA